VQDPDAELSVYIVIFSLIEIIRRILFLFRGDDGILVRKIDTNYDQWTHLNEIFSQVRLRFC